jgi:hypothetical protein
VPFDSEDVALELRRWRADVIDFSIRGGSLTDGETHSADNDKGTGEGVRSWKPLRVWGSDESPQFSLYTALMRSHWWAPLGPGQGLARLRCPEYSVCQRSSSVVLRM